MTKRISGLLSERRVPCIWRSWQHSIDGRNHSVDWRQRRALPKQRNAPATNHHHNRFRRSGRGRPVRKDKRAALPTQRAVPLLSELLGHICQMMVRLTNGQPMAQIMERNTCPHLVISTNTKCDIALLFMQQPPACGQTDHRSKKWRTTSARTFRAQRKEQSLAENNSVARNAPHDNAANNFLEQTRNKAAFIVKLVSW